MRYEVVLGDFKPLEDRTTPQFCLDKKQRKILRESTQNCNFVFSSRWLLNLINIKPITFSQLHDPEMGFNCYFEKKNRNREYKLKNFEKNKTKIFFDKIDYIKSFGQKNLNFCKNQLCVFFFFRKFLNLYYRFGFFVFKLSIDTSFITLNCRNAIGSSFGRF